MDRVLQPNCRRTLPLPPTGVIEPASVRDQLSKSRVGQVWATGVLPSVEVTSSTKFKARRNSCQDLAPTTHPNTIPKKGCKALLEHRSQGM